MKCKKKMPLAKNGNERGVCSREANHRQRHGNHTCYRCGVQLTSKSAPPSKMRRGGVCRKCFVEENRERLGQTPQVYQVARSQFMFICGCSGVLSARGQSNQFTLWTNGKPGYFRCRVSNILRSSAGDAKKHGYTPINPNTPHLVIRQMMEEKNCTLCGNPLDWSVLGRGTTPHLHHDHVTGQIYGFAHAKCNPLALQRRVRELETEVKQLKEFQAVLPKAA